jgi:hypothetical protein
MQQWSRQPSLSVARRTSRILGEERVGDSILVTFRSSFFGECCTFFDSTYFWHFVLSPIPLDLLRYTSVTTSLSQKAG